MIDTIIGFILKLIKNIFLGFIGLILLLILIRSCNVWIVNPYKLKTEVIEEYKEKNILLKRWDIGTGFNRGFITTSSAGSTYWFEIINPKQFKNKLFDIEDNKYGSYPLRGSSQYYLPNLVYNGQVNYVIKDLINDKNKGNDFSEIKKIVERNKEEILDKGFYHRKEDYDMIKNRKFRFIVRILTPTDEVYEGKKVYKGEYGYYILNEDKTILTEVLYLGLKYKEPEKYFDKMTRYKEINWEEYINKNGNLIFLIPAERLDEINFGAKEFYEDDDIEDRKSVEYFLNLFKEFEKYHNKETYRFAVLKRIINEK
ncbi:hypothetical protein [Streptobacillus canis]|uniref:hypothetical protein n=1 Tax=Streptobacillus canis TaxID=2678686 RepID=UPI0012E20FB8|nr:hypothetical protein [Streptobacillus canis]